MSVQETLDRLAKLKVALLLDQPWWGTLLMRLKVEVVGVGHVYETLATDGTTLWVNSVYLAGITDAEAKGVLAHEVSHCALKHMYRRKDRDGLEWNEAADYVINPSLVRAGFTLRPNVLLDWKFEGWTVEQVFSFRRNEKSKEEEQQQQQGGQDQPEDGQGEQSQEGQGGEQQPGQSEAGAEGQEGAPAPGSGGSPAEGGSEAPVGQQPDASGPQEGTAGAETAPAGVGDTKCGTGTFVDAPPMPEGAEANNEALTETDWDLAAEQAARVAKKAGKLPAGMEGTLRKVREDGVDWVAVLREYFQQVQPTDYSWLRPNRRFVSDGLFLPGTVKDQLGVVVIGGDTSGSIGADLWRQFGNGINRIVQESQPEKVFVTYCDAMVQRVEEFGPGDEVELHPKGGGGTMFRPVFDWVESENLTPAVLVYFTDLECCDVPVDPGYPVVWVTPEWVKEEGLFGRTIRLNG